MTRVQEDNRINEIAGQRGAILPCPNTITFTLSSIPPSVNGIYQIIYRERRVELKPQCRAWKRDAKEEMPIWRLATDDSLIRIDVTLAFPHFYKSTGKRRLYDPANSLKLLIDAIAERYRFNDNRVLSGGWSSVNDLRESAQVTVTEIPSCV